MSDSKPDPRRAGTANRRGEFLKKVLRYLFLVPLARNLVMVAVLLAAALFLEFRQDVSPQPTRCDLIEARTGSEGEEGIARLALSGYRDVRSRRVTVIALSEDSDPSSVLGNLCEQRWYIARLVDALTSMGAAEIVIDKFFAPKTCPDGDPNTSAFMSAVQRTPVPVIVGRATHPPKSSDANNSCLILSESLDFGNKVEAGGRSLNAPAVLLGLTRLNSDVRRIPMSWSCYSNDAEFSSGVKPTIEQADTLSWLAASRDPGLEKEPRMMSLRARGQHPFTSFIAPEDLSHAEALSVLCLSAAKDEIASRYGVDCSRHPLGETPIRGSLIVIGEDVQGKDRHMLFGRDVSGVYLQANYIESLLDDRFMKALDTAWNYAGFLSWLALLYVIFWLQPEVALAISVAGILIVRYLLAWVVVRSGYYPQISILDVGIVAPVLKYIESRGHMIVHAIREYLEKGRAARHRGRKPGSKGKSPAGN